MTKKPTAVLLTDFYKIGHTEQYPPGTQYVYSTWIPRASMISDIDRVVAFGFQSFIQTFLIDYFAEHFFGRPKDEVIAEYRRMIKHTLMITNPKTDHMEYLHGLGYLPLLIKAVPEGTKVPLRVPMLTIENTDPNCFWLTNAVESLFSCEIWHMCTSATIANSYREILEGWAEKTGAPMEGVGFQAHDFSFRGLEGVEAVAKSGAGHLLSFVGTDNIPSICYHEAYYGANVETELVGTSIAATEHAVMCAHGRDEVATLRFLMELYPTGMFSCVMDTWDLWNVLTEVFPYCKDEIMARDGRVVIRPDSGDPVDIICGERGGDGAHPSAKGVIELLWDTFGGEINHKGFKVLDPHVGCIYGDSITRERADAICARLAAKGFCSSNIVFGVGSYTYQYNTRDTFGFALKSTWVMRDGTEYNIFKDPVTDNGTKKSLTGRVVVGIDPAKGMTVMDGLSEKEQDVFVDVDQLRPVFLNGTPASIQTLAEIRELIRA